MKIVWTREARQERLEIFEYIGAASPDAALRLDQLFEDAVASLNAHSKLGHPGKVKGTRELFRTKAIGLCTRSMAIPW